MQYLYHAKVAPGLDYDCLADAKLHLKKNDEVIIKCEHYEDFGVVVQCSESAPATEKTVRQHRSQNSKGRRIEGRKVPVISRRATLVDKGKAHENDIRARSMHRTAAQRIEYYKLDMKLINTHYSFDKKLVVFQFTSDGRVDFRDLLKDLSNEWHTRVELRQVGVRDEAAIQGGIGPCGRTFCCASFLSRFTSINVKMAKQQGLSLNPSNISGACGRLKCCLNYEAHMYRHDSRGHGSRQSEHNKSSCAHAANSVEEQRANNATDEEGA